MKFLLLMLVTLAIVATRNIAMEIFKARSQWGYRNHVMVLALTWLVMLLFLYVWT